MNVNALLAAAGLSVFSQNVGQSPADYATDQMKDRGTSFINGPFKDTGRKIVAAQAVNGVALVTLSRVNLKDTKKADVKGFQITAYDLAGNVLSETPLDDTAPKGTKRGYSVYGDVLAEIGKRDDLILAAIRSERDASQARTDKLDRLLADASPGSQEEVGAEADEAEIA